MSMTDLAARNDVDAEARFGAANVVKERPARPPQVALPVQAKPLDEAPQQEPRREQEPRLGALRRLFTRFGRCHETIEYRLPDGAGMLGRNDFDPLIGRRI
jgi:hypothetical protein